MQKLFQKFDPRWILLTNHTLLLGTGLLFYNLNRSLAQIALGLSAAIVSEILVARLFRKETQNVQSRILSALIAGLGFLILTFSKSLWYYPAGSFIAIASKYLFRFDKDRHIYNPTGFAIVFAFAFFPDYKPLIYVDTFLVATFPTLQVMVLGLLATMLARRWVLSLS